MPTCTLTDVLSWFACAQRAVPFAEIITIVVFLVFFTTLKLYSLRESLTASLFISTITAAAFYGMGLTSGTFVTICIVLTAVSAVFLNSQQGG